MPPPGPVSLTLQVPPFAHVAAIGGADGTDAIGGADGTVAIGGADGTVAIVTGVVIGGSSAIVGFANTLLSATTGREGVATSVDSKTGTGSETPGITTADACSTAGGNGDVANHSFLPFATPQTHTTDFFLRTAATVRLHDTDRPLDFIVGYQMLPVFVFPHTTATFDIFDI
ncbi:MAG: hypothetical protein WCL35_09730 [bacterium]